MSFMDLKDEDVVGLFFEVMKLNRSYSENRYGNMDVFRGQYSCLFILERTGLVSQKKLADILRIRPSSVGEILAKLEAKGLICRTPSPEDGRVLLVSLTEEGKAAAQQVRENRAVAHKEMLSGLTKEEKRGFYQALRKIQEYYLRQEEEHGDRN